MFKGIFVADLHCSKSRLEDCKKVLNTLIEKLESYEERPYLFISGDFWDSVITNGETFAEYLMLLKRLLNLTEVFMIYGTPTHDIEGSLEVFKHLGAHVYSENTFEDRLDFELIAIPEPRKSHYVHLVKKDMDISDVINEDLKKFASSVPEKRKTRIVLYHGEIVGISYDNGIACTSKIAVTPKYLKSFNADFIGCGHIHLKQEVFENCWYLGSAPQKTLGEHHEPGYMEVEIE